MHSRLLILSLLATTLAAAPKELTLATIFAEPGPAGPTPTQLRWSPDGKTLTYILERENGKERDLWAVEAGAAEPRRLVSHETLASLAPKVEDATSDERERERRRRYSVASYLWSPDSSSLLFTSAGKLYLYDVAAERPRPIAPEKSGVKYPKFSPNGRWISFVWEHDIWSAPAAGGDALPVTKGGHPKLLHGDLDWVYPEELAVRSGYFWSPDSRRIAFLELNQAPVPEYPITDLRKVEPGLDLQRYPKSGDPNPRARVAIAEFSRLDDPPPLLWLELDAEYIPRITWAGNDWVAIQLLNRGQTELRLEIVNAKAGNHKTLFTETDPHWINISDDLKFLGKDKGFLWTSERSGFRHIYLYDYDGKLQKQLTEGDWEVKEISAVDKEGGWIYYLANEDNPIGADLYRVRMDGSSKERLTAGKGTATVTFNKQGTAYALRWSALTDPGWWDVVSGDARVRIYEGKRLDEYELIAPQLSTIQSEDGATIRLMLLKPEGLRPGEKRPMLVYVYGGPRAPTIRDHWGSRGRYLWHQRLAQKGYVVAQIDDRASSLLGHKYETALFRAYGPTALTDQLTAIEHLKSLGFVDPANIAIWGWSGGGFATAFGMTHSKVFKAGISGAPVTDWRLYDSIYTERYMGLPAEEEEAYMETSAVRAANDLHGRILFVHGTSDDNVHIQNTVKMIDALIAADKPYELLIYPGKTHGVAGAKTRVHLHRSMEEFLARTIGKP